MRGEEAAKGEGGGKGGKQEHDVSKEVEVACDWWVQFLCRYG